MTRFLLPILIALASISCGAPNGRPANTPGRTATTKHLATTTASHQDWLGVYASPDEVSGFSGTVLALETGSNHGIAYRMHFYSDVSSPDDIEAGESRGSCLTDGRTLYLPVASGFMIRGKPRLLASIDRYTLVDLNGQHVLMRDDAYHTFRMQNKLHDYGILIKVSDEADVFLDLHKVQHPSIKLLYSDPSKPWKDPFVHGPNDR